MNKHFSLTKLVSGTKHLVGEYKPLSFLYGPCFAQSMYNVNYYTLGQYSSITALLLG